MSVLTDIQNELKAPKGRYNSFGKYNYRSCEDILEAVKPILKKHGATLTIRDDMVEVGGRVYVKAIAQFHVFGEKGSVIEGAEVTAFAREADEKKGMDASQITGTASSYARKYALNGLFLIDDTKDADTDEYANQQNQAKQQKQTEKQQDVKKQKIGSVKGAAVEKMLKDSGQNVEAILKYYKCDKCEDLTEEQHLILVNSLRNHLAEKEKNGSNGKA